MLYATLGLPRSGKTTFCNIWTKDFPKRVIVSGDDIRLALTGQRFNPAAESTVQSLKCTMIRTLLIRNFTVIHEGTNTTLNSVKNLEKLVESVADNIVWLIFNTPADICKERAILTKQEDLIDVIDRMDSQQLETVDYLLQKNKGKIIRVKQNNAPIIHHRKVNNEIHLCTTSRTDLFKLKSTIGNIILVDYK